MICKDELHQIPRLTHCNAFFHLWSLNEHDFRAFYMVYMSKRGHMQQTMAHTLTAFYSFQAW